jgi:hypothetical protein
MMRTFNRQVATAVPLNANYNSPYVQLRNIYTYTMSAIITGTPTGTIQIQASNDPETNDTQTNVVYGSGAPPTNPPSVAPVNWVTITNSPFVVSSAGEEMWNVNYAGYNYVRVQYIDASGGTSTATMKIVFNGKGV